MRRCLLLLTALALLVAFPAPGLAQHRRGKHKSIGGLSNKLASVRQNKQRMIHELNVTKKQANHVAIDIHQVDKWLNDIQDQLDDTTQRLDDSRSEQKRLSRMLAQTTKRLDSTKAQMRHRMRAMYVSGQGSFLSAIMGSQNVGDIASRAYLYQRIAKKDRSLFDSYVALKSEVSIRKRQQDAVVRRVAVLADTQRHQRANLAVAKEQKREALADLYQRADHLKDAIAQFDRDEASIQSEIVEYMRRAREAALAEAKRRKQGGHHVPRGHASEIESIVLSPFSGRFSRPVNGRITSTFGRRYHPILHIVRMHTGIDFGAHVGTPIMAAADGVVISTAYMRGYGNTVIVEHGGGISTVYAHTSRVFVRSGQRVHRGQRIAAVGATGLATGPHLHFEVRVNGRPVNPLGRF
jgi:murein DD-endopeptidase MepM/ murein hydrolase activator NlpD